MTGAGLVAAGGALALAALLGVSDAPNAVAALVSSRAGSYRPIAAWSVGWHLAGGLLAGSTVAATVVGMVRVPVAAGLTAVLAAGCWSAVLFTWVTTRRGLPTSASVGLVGGLAGAGAATGGWHAVSWSLVGGVLAGILLAPAAGGLAAAVLESLVRRAARRLRRRAAGPLRAGIWAACAAVALADGSNDGQKPMGILAVALSGAGTAGGAGPGISWPDRIACSALLAAFTVVADRAVVTTVARGLSRSGAADDLAAQVSSAAVILLAGASGLPLSTSTVVTSAKAGAGMARRRLRAGQVLRIATAWAVTVPGCAACGAALMGLWRLAG